MRTAYVAIQALLLAIAFLISTTWPDIGTYLVFAVIAIGTATLAGGLLRYRPEPRTGWWLLVVALALHVAHGISVPVTENLTANTIIDADLPAALAGLAFLPLTLGLVSLARALPRGGPADVLDALMTGVGALMLLWIVGISTGFETNIATVTGTVVYPIAAFVLFIVIVKLVLGGALRDPAVRLVVLATALEVGSICTMLLRSIETGALHTNRLAALLWGAYAAVLGASGLHPALARRLARENVDGRETSTRRIAGFAGLVLLAPVAWATQALTGDPVEARTYDTLVPLVASALFLLLLVARLGLVAHLAQERSRELSRRSAALAEAVSEQEKLQRQLVHQATHDPLTGLPNRILLADQLRRALEFDSAEQFDAAKRRHALLLSDLDGFKDVNDTLGHPVGDEVLAEVARRLRNCVPDGATVARLGGDEFAVFLESVDSRAAGRCAERIVATLRKPYAVAECEFVLTVSVGVFVIDAACGPVTASEALRKADVALYAAKRAGKNQSVSFGAESPESSQLEADRGR